MSAVNLPGGVLMRGGNKGSLRLALLRYATLGVAIVVVARVLLRLRNTGSGAYRPHTEYHVVAGTSGTTNLSRDCVTFVALREAIPLVGTSMPHNQDFRCLRTIEYFGPLRGHSIRLVSVVLSV